VDRTDKNAPLFDRLCASARVVWLLQADRRSDQLSLEELEAKRDWRLRRIVRFAARHVPYYQNLFAERGLDPAEVRTAADLDELPLMDKEMVRQQPERFQAAGLARRGLHLRTSGTTARPLGVVHDRGSVLSNVAYTDRERRVVRDMLGSRRHRTLAFGYEQNTGSEVRRYLRRQLVRPPDARRIELPLTTSLDRVAEALNRHRPQVVSGPGSYLDVLFLALHDRRMLVQVPDLVVFHGSAMSDPVIELLQQEYAIPAIGRYNAVEAFKIGFQCGRQPGYHLHVDLTHLRILDRQGRNQIAGESGEIVISNLVNFGTVLLNYRLGDMGILGTASCPCGRRFPSLVHLDGRMEDMLRTRDGGIIHPRNVWQIFKGRPQIVQYQLIQHSYSRYEIRMTAAHRRIYNEQAQEILVEMKALLGEESLIELVYVESFPACPPGKFRPTISHVQSPVGGRKTLQDGS
jgi:phenylacetate-CoA ligase